MPLHVPDGGLRAVQIHRGSNRTEVLLPGQDHHESGRPEAVYPHQARDGFNAQSCRQRIIRSKRAAFPGLDV